MLYIFWILGMLAFKLAISDQCQCILLCVRILLANLPPLSTTSETLSYTSLSQITIGVLWIGVIFVTIYVWLCISNLNQRRLHTRVGHAYANMRFMQIMRICGICGCGWKSHPHYPHVNICQKWQLFGSKMGHPGSVFNSECPKYQYCSSHLVLSLLRNKK